MKHSTSIEWTHAPGYKGETWNPVTGCDKISAGCAHCYAADVAKRFWGDRPFSDVQFHEERLQQPLRWKKPRMVFVNSMSDLFHDAVTDEQLDEIFAVMALTPQHVYQVLTKRPERMVKYFRRNFLSERWASNINWLRYDNKRRCDKYSFPDYEIPLQNVWLGVTVENQKAADERIPLLLRTPAAVRFLSCEPLLEEIDLLKVDAYGFGGNQGHKVDCIRKGYWSESIGFVNHSDMHEEFGALDWVVIGGESGTKARLFNADWAFSLIRQCKDADVPVFMKQLGSDRLMPCRDVDHPDFDKLGPTYRITGKGGNPDEWPEGLRVREWPKVLGNAVQEP